MVSTVPVYRTGVNQTTLVTQLIYLYGTGAIFIASDNKYR